MPKRLCPWANDNGPYTKCHVSGKDLDTRSHVAMEAVYNKTLSKLFNGAKNVRNNNLQLPENTPVINQKSKDVLNDTREKLNEQQLHFEKTLSTAHKQTNFHKLCTSNDDNSRSIAFFNIDFSHARNIEKTAPICVSCIRFSSTAGALNPSILASRQPCSSCTGLTCQLCLNQCKGCSSAVCGNCSIDIEAVNGHKAEMFIVCLGCRDCYDSTSCMDTG